jgi:hypothetical protein
VPLPWWGLWAGGYLGVLMFVVVRAALGREATLVSGRFLFAFTVVYAAAALVASLVTGSSISVIALAWIAGLAIAAWLSRAHALAFGELEARTAEVLVECGRRVCLTGELTAGGYRFPLPGGALDVRLRAVGRGVTLITFRAAPGHRKAQLFEKLVAKQYRRPLPVIRVRQR